MSLLSLQFRLKDNRKHNTYGSHVSRTEQPWIDGRPRPYEVRPRKDREGIDLISDCFETARSGMQGPTRSRYAIAYAKYRSHSRSQRAIIRVLDDSGAVVQMHDRAVPLAAHPTAATSSRLVIGWAVLACALKTPRITSQIREGIRMQKWIISQCDRTCGHIPSVSEPRLRY